MSNQKYLVGDPVRITRNVTADARSNGIKPGMFGSIIRANYDDVSQHTVYTVRVGRKEAYLRASALSYR